MKSEIHAGKQAGRDDLKRGENFRLLAHNVPLSEHNVRTQSITNQPACPLKLNQKLLSAGEPGADREISNDG